MNLLCGLSIDIVVVVATMPKAKHGAFVVFVVGLCGSWILKLENWYQQASHNSSNKLTLNYDFAFHSSSRRANN